jgi:hypothetical protein
VWWPVKEETVGCDMVAINICGESGRTILGVRGDKRGCPSHPVAAWGKPREEMMLRWEW